MLLDQNFYEMLLRVFIKKIKISYISDYVLPKNEIID